MKYLVAALLLCAGMVYADETTAAPSTEETSKPEPAKLAVGPKAGEPKVEQCFKVHWLLKTDDEHYWADWANTCPYIIDQVYVMVGFESHGNEEMGNGVWPMYFVEPGAHETNRFSAPPGVAGYETMKVHQITTDTMVAFSQDRKAVEAVEHTTEADGTVGDSSFGRVVRAK